ncbi:tol-pal system protein YbgF [Thalassomonas viridans]|uniref:Cell division coordinator CpoB n=1 Tax=Thalassomonas viridans TaxID=137584 RepID=A0AAE9Z6P2_9GAMM|nr:tol-pal system protein YbgF [Thalassomonas viridans]WDE07237.1 tol-pal system protein YbgF [Thalassomonas viridans]
MKLNNVLLGMMLTAGTFGVLAADPAPVFDVNAGQGTQTGNFQSSLPAGSVAEKMAHLERKLEARNRAQVRIQQQLDELQTEVNEIRGATELHTHQLTQVLERQRELYQELDRRVSEALKPANQVPASIAATDSGKPGEVNYSSDLTENEAYDHAVNLVLKDKKYQQAITEFDNFNKKYPNSTYAANAHYWLGQLLFNKGDLDKAKQEFDIVVNQHKGSNKRADAMLKLAMVAQKQNNKSRAVVLYRQLIEEYPGSTAAKLAQPRLDSLAQ